MSVKIIREVYEDGGAWLEVEWRRRLWNIPLEQKRAFLGLAVFARPMDDGPSLELKDSAANAVIGEPVLFGFTDDTDMIKAYLDFAIKNVNPKLLKA